MYIIIILIPIIVFCIIKFISYRYKKSEEIFQKTFKAEEERKEKERIQERIQERLLEKQKEEEKSKKMDAYSQYNYTLITHNAAEAAINKEERLKKLEIKKIQTQLKEDIILEKAQSKIENIIRKLKIKEMKDTL